VESVGRHDNFFDLGGHSLLLSKVLTQVRAISTRPLAMVDLFQYPTVQDLAAYLNGGRTSNEADGCAQTERMQQTKARRLAGLQRLQRQREQRQTTTDRT
jgi:hypothetical protein